MTTRRSKTAAAFMIALLTATTVLAQSTASISGVVVDADGGVIPGADVVVKNVATAETFSTVSSDKGVFSIPAMITGTYSVTVSLTGFKTAVLNNVIVNAGVPANVRATLEVGGLAEEVLVTANSALVPMQNATVATVLDTRQVASLPLSSRNAAEFVVFLPGVTTPGETRDSIVNGLPQSTINMTLDGVNIQDNTNKTTDGFFAIVGPRLDAVEEISFTTAASGAESTGSGATQIRYTTKSGTNDFHGSLFHQYRSDALNTNTWFNKRDGLPKPELLQNQPGFNFGGPVMLPGFNGRNKAFFFVNYEELRQPQDIRRIRQIFHPDAERGVFRYSTAAGVQTVSLFDLAARNGQLATPDPIVSRLLGDIRVATAKEGNVRDLTDPLYQEYSYLVPTRSQNRYPTVRLDYQLSARHRVTWSMNFQYFGGGPDTTNNREAYFPGFPVVADQWSTRRATSGWLRSIVGPTMVNEFRIGYGGAPVVFAQGQFNQSMFNGPLANQGGFYLNMANAMGLTASQSMNAGASGTTSGRDSYNYLFEDTLNWQKGAHSINVGGSFTQYALWAQNQNIVPELRFDAVTGDPAELMFTAANFPGASSTNLTNARRLYAILTGRISEVRGVARLDPATNKYLYLGQSEQRARQRQVGLWLQDGWHVGPNFTLNYGARYDLTFPFISLNNSYSIGDLADVFGVSGEGNLFKPGTLTGKAPTFHQFSAGERAYPMDWNNISPSIGFAWTPSAEEGFLHRLTGGPSAFVVRAGYNRSYTRLGLGDFTGAIDDNPGVSLNPFRSQTLGNLGALPLLLREPSRLGPADFSATPTFPFTDVVSEDITIFSPDLVVPLSDTWQAGISRALGSTMSVEARYLGARSHGNWRTNDYNERNIAENGFLDEFKLAMANLQANNAAGGTRAGSFAYFGPGSGTVPLPIYLAYIAGRTDTTNAAAYTTSTAWTNTALTQDMVRTNPLPFNSAADLDGDLNRRNFAIAAGLPANFFVLNPQADTVNVTDSGAYSDFHALQLELRRRLSRGLMINASYQYAIENGSAFLGFHYGRV